MRLLLAEDEKEMSAALSAILTHSGYDVDAVYDGQAAVEKALSQSYDCMIFDIMMPKKDGVQALKEIRDKGNMTPVIMLTAKAEIDDRITGLDAGADDFNAEDSVFEITTDPDAFNDVVKALEEKNYAFVSADISLVPQTYVKLESDEDIKNMEKLLDMLDDNEDVQNTYHNWDQE